jgi:hypothetical protein
MGLKIIDTFVFTLYSFEITGGAEGKKECDEAVNLIIWEKINLHKF